MCMRGQRGAHERTHACHCFPKQPHLNQKNLKTSHHTLQEGLCVCVNVCMCVCVCLDIVVRTENWHATIQSLIGTMIRSTRV